MTLSGAWDKLRTDPILRLMVVSLAFYGMSTFEGPMMSIKVVNSLSHYTDWTIGHVHSGALGWVAYVSFGALYCLVPWLWNRREVYSLKLVDWHFWVSTVGIVLYITSMWVAGIMQGLMWRAYNALGFLEYSFAETVEAMQPYYLIRAIGGVLFLIGALIMAYNIAMTILGREAEEAEHRLTPALAPAGDPSPTGPSTMATAQPGFWKRHELFERNSILLVIGILIVVAIGGLIEIVPLFYLKSTIEKVEGMRPYTPLELAGRNIYVREGCYLCHSQMVRPMRDEVERYGHFSLAAESMYDHPFQWGSKRTGPDLARVGGKYSDEWHRDHLKDPVGRAGLHHARVSVPGPSARRRVHLGGSQGEPRRRVPYTDEMIKNAHADLLAQANPDDPTSAEFQKRYPNVAARDFDGNPKRVAELDALVAYLQMLGTSWTSSSTRTGRTCGEAR